MTAYAALAIKKVGRAQYGGVEKLISLGPYPDVSLKRAREKRDEARKLLADGIDPSIARLQREMERAVTFRMVAHEWLDMKAKSMATVTLQKAQWLLDLVFPRIGNRPIKAITPPELLLALRRIENKGQHETAHRAKQKIGQVYRYAVATGRADRDITADLRGALASIVVKNHAAIVDPKEVGALLRAIDEYQGQPVTKAALRLAPLVFVRPGELRGAMWKEFDLVAGEWRIPAARMKMRDSHIVPLARQAVEILTELKGLTGFSEFAFPSMLSPKRPMSNNTVNTAIRRLGYSKDEMTGHGFRSMASTLLNEQGYPPDVIELQLAHSERNKVRAAYNRAKRLPERRQMMQARADYLELLRDGAHSMTAAH